MIDTKHGDYDFPLITGLHLRIPSSKKSGGPAHVLQQHAANTAHRGVIAADREFNNYRPQHFQAVARTLGFHTAYDYKNLDLGKSVKVPGKPVVLVDGWLYVDYMPEKYVKIAKWVADGKVDPYTGQPYTEQDLTDIITARLDYAMVPNGKLKKGVQEFKYPDPRNYVAYDPETGDSVPIAERPRKTQTVSIGSTEEHYPIIKHLQHAPWHTTDWYRQYNQRNQVESSNKVMKDGGFVAIGDKARRRARGYAFTYLATIAATFAMNLKRISVGILKIFERQRLNKTRVSKKQAAARQHLTASPAISSGSPPSSG